MLRVQKQAAWRDVCAPVGEAGAAKAAAETAPTTMNARRPFLFTRLPRRPVGNDPDLRVFPSAGLIMKPPSLDGPSRSPSWIADDPNRTHSLASARCRNQLVNDR